jgi:hypothetical protein
VWNSSSSERRAHGAGNATDPRVGSGMQQAREPRAEEAVEVVRNHEDGTRSGRWNLTDRSTTGIVVWEWTLEVMSMEGNVVQRPARAGPWTRNPTREGQAAPAMATRLDQGDRLVLRRGREDQGVCALRRKEERVGR